MKNKFKPAFYDLGFSESEALALTFKADILLKILDVVKEKQIKPRALEGILKVPQPRISELLNGKISQVSIEKLLTYLDCLGIVASISFKRAKAG